METDLKAAFEKRLEVVTSSIAKAKSKSRIAKLVRKYKLDEGKGRILLSVNTTADLVEPSHKTTLDEVVIHYRGHWRTMKVVKEKCDGILVTFVPRNFNDDYPAHLLDDLYTHPEIAARLKAFLPN